MQRSKTSSKFKRTFVSASVAMAIASTMGIFAIPQAHALVAATHVYHNHMPNFWPYYDVNQYANTKVGDPIRYTYDGQVIRIKENPPAGYTYFNPSSGKVMPHDDFQAYYQHHAKQGAYKSWPIETAQSNISAAEENLRLAELSYKEGLISVTDLLAAQTAWISANSDKIDAGIDARMCELYLRKAVGISNLKKND